MPLDSMAADLQDDFTLNGEDAILLAIEWTGRKAVPATSDFAGTTQSGHSQDAGFSLSRPGFTHLARRHFMPTAY